MRKGRGIPTRTPATNASKRRPNTNRKSFMRDIPFKLRMNDTGRRRRRGNQDYT